ncbi:acyl-CoA synthetase (AMP-forming)/AMP-acid ligase II [Streptomyces sp. 3211.6]|uniref:AMP-binding protein n=1 Tax=Streptomyces TaxID=1883 RepID=UPI0009A55420|nr:MULTISPECIES: AMP-binding protein [Streptomyces]RKT03851.1 acyl-CoA synthetase (AMP-forming)/AMP-acid ligase II [Streptomyces sp. 3211.6]RPF39721.1 acyl-CoA synthetase (AMP-forming)/AMP-acid ligase II [Streptomyces sp. Ag109_G2-6]
MTAAPADASAVAGGSPYAARPWLRQLSAAQLAPVAPPASVLDAFRAAVARAPERAALAYFDGRIGYAEADALSDSLAGYLAQRGVRRGDRVAVMLQNTPHFVLAVLAAWKAGAVVVPVNPMYKSAETRHVLGDSGAVALVCEGAAWEGYLAEAVRETGVRTVLTARARDFQTRDDPRVFPPPPQPSASPPAPAPAPDASAVSAPVAAAPASPAPAAAFPLPPQPSGPPPAPAPAAADRAAPEQAAPAPDVASAAPAPVDLLFVARQGHPGPADPGLREEDIALISYTSGTSGAPKGAMNPHGAITYNAVRQVSGHPIAEGAGYFVLAPLFHITGLVCELTACLVNAGTLVLAHRFDAGAVLDAFLEHRPAYTIGPATAFTALAAHPAATRAHFASFQVISSGGAPLPPALVERLRADFGFYLRNGYGLTECTAPCASVPAHREAPVDPAGGTLSVGVPGAQTLVRILDEHGAELPLGQTGEIAVRGPQVVPGYWGLPDETAAAFPDGELRTGDVGFMDADGWLYVVDRKKDMISASGFKVWPREVEDVLYTHPAVREAAVVGVPDAYRGESVIAYVSLRPGARAEPAELVAYCAERLAAYKYPRRVEILPVLPQTTSGKILRRELRERG